MKVRSKRLRPIGRGVVVLAIAASMFAAFAGNAAAHTGAYAKFNYCPSTTAGVFKCLYSVTNGGAVNLGKKKVPIVNPVTLQGGVLEENEEGFSGFVGATNGVTLSKTPQPVPGGLSGLVNCKEITVGWLRSSCEVIFENGLTGVNSTLELARPANQIVVSQSSLAGEEGVALQMPVKVHLENPLLGSGCFIGSSGTPLLWNLTTGATSPPAPTNPIHGATGKLHILEEGAIIEFTGNELVDNAWSAPGANGCGGVLGEWILDPIINASVGVPSAAGKNSATLKNTISVAAAGAVNNH
jgi:hypothetical protein